MEELFEFMKEAREMDRIIELEHATEQGRQEGSEEGRQEGREEGIIIMIKNFIKSCKEKPTAATLAAIFDVQEPFVQPLL